MSHRSRREFLALTAGGLLAAPLLARGQDDLDAPEADDGRAEPAGFEQAIIVDHSGGVLHAGLAGADAPSVVFPSIVGRPRHQGVMVGMGQKDAYVGDEAQSKRGILTLKYPVERGVVVRWDDMEKVWHHAFFGELRMAPEEHPVLLSEAPIASKQSRETTAKIMFEVFNVPGLYIAPDGVLALYASGATTGVVLMMRDGLGWVEPIYEGTLLRHAVVPVAVSPRDVTDYLAKLLAAGGQPFPTVPERDLVRALKAKHGFVAPDFAKAMAEAEGAPRVTETLPNGRTVTLGSERFQAPELLFQPTLAGLAGLGLHQAIHQAVQKCDPEIRADLYGNVVLAGGGTLFDGLDARLTRELRALAPPGAPVKVVAPPGRAHSVWTGASVIASLDAFQQAWLTRAQYAAGGAGAVHQRFL